MKLAPNLRGRAWVLHDRRSRTNAAKASAAVIAVGVALLILQGPDRVDGAEPDLMQTPAAEDATLNNEFIPLAADWVKTRQGRQTVSGFGLEKQLSERLGLTIAGQYDFWSARQQHSSTGFGNVGLQLTKVCVPEVARGGLCLRTRTGLIAADQFAGRHGTRIRGRGYHTCLGR
jgi:hypothetical protein